MKWIVLPFLFASALLLAACGSKKEEVDQGENNVSFSFCFAIFIDGLQ